MAYLVKDHREAHDKDIVGHFYAYEDVSLELKKLHLTGSFVTKVVLKFVEEVIFIGMLCSSTCSICM